MGQTLQVVRRKYMVKGCFEVQKNDFGDRSTLFSQIFYQKWIKIVLIHRKCKFLFKKT